MLIHRQNLVALANIPQEEKVIVLVKPKRLERSQKRADVSIETVTREKKEKMK